jgi:hypothetical protein
MSDFLGNLAARSLGRAAVLRPLPRFYGAPVVDSTPAAADLAEPSSFATQARSSAPLLPIPEERPEQTIEPERRPAAAAARAPAATPELQTLPAAAAPLLFAPPATPRRAADVAPLPQAHPVAKTTAPLPPLTLPAENHLAETAAAEPITTFVWTEPAAVLTAPARAVADGAVADAGVRQVETAPVVVRMETSLREAPLSFRLPELARPRAGQAAAAPTTQTAVRRASTPSPPAPAVAEPQPVSVTIGRLEIRVAAPTRAPAAAPATPPVMSLEDYLRSRGRGGEP